MQRLSYEQWLLALTFLAPRKLKDAEAQYALEAPLLAC